MEERRNSRRIDLECTLLVKRIDSGHTGEISIEIQDISKSGIGFLCKERLEMDAVYEAYMTIWTKEVIHTLLRIVRMAGHGEDYLYGAVFMGLTDIDAYRISLYDEVEKARSASKE